MNLNFMANFLIFYKAYISSATMTISNINILLDTLRPHYRR